MRAVVFATAGHIDHGKTALVAALTGINCDRLEEERRRGITIVLGFAPLADPAGELEISFVDVPGHERLVHTMIAGAGAVDRALLVVAADEGVMPQTREHLEVLDLLGVRGGVVAINKSDLVDADTLTARREELRSVLAGGPLTDAPVLCCSAARGDGIEALREALLGCAREVRRREEAHRPFRMGLDRVFTLPGAGTVVTGTVRWGRVADGDELLVLPEGRKVRVRGVQVHGRSRAEGRVGERVALRLAGASVAELPRGDQVVSAGSWHATRRVALAVRLLPSGHALEEGDELRLHLLAGRRRARIERLFPTTLDAGARGWAIVRLGGGLFAAPGDRVVLRWPSPARTIGGGTVLDADPPHLRRREAARLAALPDLLTDPDDALANWVAEAGPAGVNLGELAARAGRVPEGLEAPLGRLVAAGKIAVVRGTPPTFVGREWREAIRNRAATVLEGAGPTGLPIAELVSRVVPAAAGRLRDFYLEDLRRSGVLREAGGRAL
jgi:selenocysteine-specific elongation factor